MRRALRTALVAAIAFPATASASPTPALPHGAPIAVFAGVEPAAIFWGDTALATITVFVDRGAVAIESIRLHASYDPFTRSPEQATPLRRDLGPVTRLTYRFSLRCLSYACVAKEPTHPVQTFKLASGLASYELRAQPGTRRTAVFRQPAVAIASRITPSRYIETYGCFGCRPTAYAYRLAPPREATYRAPPLLLASVGFGLAGVLAGLGALFARRWWRALHPRTRIEAVAAAGPLDLALAHLDWALAHGSELDRRKALGRVAAELDGAQEIAAAAQDLAWAEPAPATSEIEALADRARKERGP